MPGQFQSTIAVHQPSGKRISSFGSWNCFSSANSTGLAASWAFLCGSGAFRTGSKGTELFDAVPSTCHRLAVFADLLFLNLPRGDTISFGQYSWSPWMAYSDWVVAAFSFSVSNWVTLSCIFCSSSLHMVLLWEASNSRMTLPGTLLLCCPWTRKL